MYTLVPPCYSRFISNLTLIGQVVSEILFYFNSVLLPFQDYFSSISRWVKMGEPQEKPPGTPASRTWLVSHVARAGLEPTPDTAVR